MNPGGEPERDDTGLPPVDIEIPDDARELDRDVQAYYREQRALRRQQRRSRLHGLMAKDGIVLPLLACCLILALITGTLLTVFTAASDQGFPSLTGAGKQAGSTGKASTGPSRAGSSSAARASRAPSQGATATPGAGRSAVPTDGKAGPLTLPEITLQVGGKPVQLRSLGPAMLVLVPAKCACVVAVAALARIAANARANAYLVSPANQGPAAAGLAAQVSSQHHASITVAVDSSDALSKYQHGLTAILVGPDQVAAVAGNLQADRHLDRLAPALTR